MYGNNVEQPVSTSNKDYGNFDNVMFYQQDESEDNPSEDKFIAYNSNTAQSDVQTTVSFLFNIFTVRSCRLSKCSRT